MKHQRDGISVGAVRTAPPAFIECPNCGEHIRRNGNTHRCNGQVFDYYSPVAELPRMRPPKRVREGGC